MDVDFKVPSADPKIKFVPKKVENPENVDNSKKNEQTIDENKTGDRVENSEKPNVSEQATQPRKLPIASKCPYTEPKWSKTPDTELNYNLEVLKGGTIVDTTRDLQTQAFWTMGKLPDNDIVMAHPTISRYHAVFQYRPDVVPDKDNDSDGDEETGSDAAADNKEKSKSKIEMGWYLYDLGSTHGCFVNKMKIPIKTYVRVRVGYMLQFGASTRKYILQGPDFDEDAESELTITEMKELKLKQEQERQEQLIAEQKKKEAEGISWGMSEDADEETDLSHNPYAATNNEELFLDDPKKTLRGFFEREGFDLEYKADEMSPGTFICRIELPVTDSNGRNITAEVCHKGKKKECVLQCAMEACRILDRHGVLRQANHEPLKRKRAKSSDDDDDDEFYDRTTEAEEKRRRKAGNEQNTALSYNELLDQEKRLREQLNETEQKIQKYQLDKLAKQRMSEADDDEDLDEFMSHLSREKQLDKTEIRKLRFEVQRLKNDLAKVKRLINITRPIDLPPLQHKQSDVDSKSDGEKKKPAMPLFGKKGTFGFGKSSGNLATKLPQAVAKAVTKSAEKPIGGSEDFVEEFDEDEEVKKESGKTETESAETTTERKETESKGTGVAEEQVDETLKMDIESSAVPKASQSMQQSECDKPTSSNTEIRKTHEESVKIAGLSKDIDYKVNESEELETPAEATASNSNEATTGASKKKRNRKRVKDDRTRDNIDIDDAEEAVDTAKYSGWIPPENQSGDGITDLNSKYGY